MNNDLISRSALKEAFLNHSCTEFEIKNKCRTDENVLALIDNALTVHGIVAFVERPKGEWEVLKGHYFTGGGDPVLICPFCHSEESKHMGGIEFPVIWNFCPNCGADMRGKTNEQIT